MSQIETSTIAQEKSTLKITVSFVDEDGDSVAPSAISWTLSDADGTVVNAREQESVSSPAASVTIVLSGDDLSLMSSETSSSRATRHLTIEATYTSDLGSDLPLRDVLIFYVDNLSYIE